MNLWSEFIRFFSGMNPVAAVCLVAGLMLVAYEIFNPNFGMLAFFGIILLAIGFAVRLMDDGSLAMFFIMTFLSAFTVLMSYLLMIRFTRYEWLSRAPVIDAAPEPARETEHDYYFLLGKQGKAATALDPDGQIEINGVTFTAVSRDIHIPLGADVRVVEVAGHKVFVKQIVQ